MIRALVKFELERRVTMLSTYVYAAILFAAGLFMIIAAGGVFRGLAVSTSSERIFVNGPHALFGETTLIALFGVFTVAAIFGQAAYQDFGHRTWMIVFTTNVKKRDYLLGRFLGAFVFSAGLFVTIVAGEGAGTVIVHFVHPETLGKISVLAYLWPLVIQVWPMLFFCGALFFTLAAIARRMAPVYVGAVILVLGYLFALTLVNDVQYLKLASLLDPLGFLSFSLETRYWTAAEQNRDLVSVVSGFGANRAVWSLVGAAIVALGIARFRPTVAEIGGRPGAKEAPQAPIAMPTATMSKAGLLASWRSAFGLASLYFREIVRSAIFWAFIVSGVIFGTMILLATKAILGTSTLPVTYQVLELARGGFALFQVILVAFYAGELVWRERDVGVQDVVDATPMPSWVSYAAKLGALLLVSLAVEGATAIVALIAQLGQGFFAIEGRLYFTELVVIDFTDSVLLCALAIALQAIVHHKYVGHALIVIYFIAGRALAALGLEDELLRFGSSPTTRYSDMNGYGHLLGPWAWYRLYWTALSLILLLIGYVFFARGRDVTWRARLRAGRRRLGAPAYIAFTASALTFAAVGSFIFYNTHMRNPYFTSKDTERARAKYEKEYKKLEDLPQPKIVGAKVDFAIYPAARRIVGKGAYRLKNETTQPIRRVMMSLPDRAAIHELRIGDSHEEPRTPLDVQLGNHILGLVPPLAPAEEADLAFSIELAPAGFAHGEPDLDVVENGTFVNNGMLPTIGYREDAELSLDADRKDYGLAPKERMAPRDDPKKIRENYIRQDADFITFEVTVSTAEDQVALAPGYLEKEWVEGGRRYFRYSMDHPILNFFSVLSARYARKRDTWNGVDLEIDYHPAHTYDLDRMMLGMKDALAYCSSAFGPYQHRQARIIEFPRYQSFAQSFPNTIPYSEAVGFIARVRDDDPEDIDYPYYITAHEIAHQWWAHQVVGANVKGATMTSESMAQYSALMVMKQKYGKARMRRFLKFELDGYLRGRALERKKELPLAQNENQPYIHYQKGSVAMYALADFIGEDRVNHALHDVVDAWRFRGPPYATSKDLVDAFRAQTPPEYAYLIDDLFETITIYDNRALSAKARKSATGMWDVDLEVSAKKTRTEDPGKDAKTIDLEFEDFVDVGALDARGDAAFLEKRRVKNGKSTIHFTVKDKPVKVGIDPTNELVDRDSDDNVTVPTYE